MTDLPFHPLANLFPLIDGDEFDALVEDIRAHGLHEPVVLYQGEILDGRNRYRACRAAGQDCRFEMYEGDDPVSYVVSLNLKRRHLSESQRAMVAAKLANLGEGRPSETAQICAVSQADAASLLNVSRRTVQHATAIQEHGVPEIRRAVDRGDVSVSAAAEVARLPREEQSRIAALDRPEFREKVREIREARQARDRFPVPSEAERLAKETGVPHVGRDGKIHTGTNLSPEQESRRHRALKVVGAFRDLMECGLSAEDLLSEMPRMALDEFKDRAKAVFPLLTDILRVIDAHEKSRSRAVG